MQQNHEECHSTTVSSQKVDHRNRIFSQLYKIVNGRPASVAHSLARPSLLSQHYTEAEMQRLLPPARMRTYGTLYLFWMPICAYLPKNTMLKTATASYWDHTKKYVQKLFDKII